MNRMAVAFGILLLIWGAIFLYSRNVKSILTLGLPGTLAMGILFLLGIKMLEKKGTVTLKHAKQAERGAIAEEKTGVILEGLPEENFIGSLQH